MLESPIKQKTWPMGQCHESLWWLFFIFLSVVDMLRELARQGRTVVFTIHQESPKTSFWLDFNWRWY